MSGQNKNRKNNNPASIDQEMMKEIIDLQKDQVSLAKSKLEFQKHALNKNAELAKLQLTAQGKYLSEAPAQKRKDQLQKFFFAGFVIVIVLLFAVFCLKEGHDAFLTYLFQGLTHIGTLAVGYLIGQRKPGNQSIEDDIIEDAEIIDE